MSKRYLHLHIRCSMISDNHWHENNVSVHPQMNGKRECDIYIYTQEPLRVNLPAANLCLHVPSCALVHSPCTGVALLCTSVEQSSAASLFQAQGVWGTVHSVVSNFCDPMDCSPPGSSVHGIFQARILEGAAISFSRGSSQPRNRTQVSIAGRFFTDWGRGV